VKAASVETLEEKTKVIEKSRKPASRGKGGKRMEPTQSPKKEEGRNF